jgi:hypothetical protein
LVRDDATNEAITAGKRQLSPGYDVRLDETPGITPDGKRYDAIQRDIVYEHIAIVTAGRQGPDVSLRFDGADVGVMLDDQDQRDDAAFRVGSAGAASVSVTSTSLSAVELDAAVAVAIAKIPGAFVEKLDRADLAPSSGSVGLDRAAKSIAIESSRWRAPSVWVSSRDLSLDALSSQLATAMGPGVTVTRGDAAAPTTRQDTATMKNCDTCGAPVKDGKYVKDHADHADLATQLATALAATAAAQAEAASQKARADKAEGERDAAKERADKADQARKDAVDQGPALARARVKLEDKAAAILGAEFKADGLSDHDIRLKVVDKLGVKVEAAQRTSADYVTARFDGAVETYEASKANVDSTRGAGQRGDAQPVMTEAQAMADAKRKADARSKPATV